MIGKLQQLVVVVVVAWAAWGGEGRGVCVCVCVGGGGGGASVDQNIETLSKSFFCLFVFLALQDGKKLKKLADH